MTEHVAQCPCKAVTVRVLGDPLMMCWCHCSDCQTFTQADTFECILYAGDKVSIKNGKENVKQFSVRDPELHRVFCQVSELTSFP